MIRRMGAHAPALIGLAGLLAFLPFGIAGQQISIAFTLLCILAFRDGRQRLNDAFRRGDIPRQLLGSLLFWIAALLLALLFSGRAPEGIRELRKLYLLLALILPVGVLIDRRELRIAIALLLLAGAAAALGGLIEHFNHLGLNRDRLDGPINSYMTTAGIFLQLSLFALALLLHEKGWLGKIAFAAFLPITTALFLTFTRGAWLGWAAGSVLLLARRRPRLLLPALLLVLALFAAHPGIRERAMTIINVAYPTNHQRFILWKAGWNCFRDRPITGWGLQSMETLIEERAGPAPSGNLSHFHNNLVQTAAAMGIVGVAALTLLMIAFFRTAAGGARGDPPLLVRGVAEGTAAAVTGFLIHGVFEWNMGDSEVITTLYALIGLAIATRALHRPKGEEFRTSAHR